MDPWLVSPGKAALYRDQMCVFLRGLRSVLSSGIRRWVSLVGGLLGGLLGVLLVPIVGSYWELWNRVHRRQRHRSEPPLFHGLPFVGHALSFGRNCPQMLQDVRDRHGDVFTLNIMGKFMTFVMDPHDFPAVIRSSAQNLDFHVYSRRVAAHAFGYEPLTDAHMRRVERLYDRLRGNHLQHLLLSMEENLGLVLKEEVPEGTGWTVVPLNALMQLVAFEATFMTLYGRSATNHRHDFIPSLLQTFKNYDFWFPMLAAEIPMVFCGRCSSSRDRLRGVFRPEDMKDWVCPSDFVQQRTQLFHEFGLSDDNAAAHHVGILWAAVANSMPIMFWTMYHLLRNRDAMDAVRHEITRETRDGRGTRDTLDKMVTLDSVVKESLRLSTMSMNLRVSQTDFLLDFPSGKRWIRNGDFVVMFPLTVHMDPEVYTDPQTFQFDRFLLDDRPRTTFLKSGRPVRQYHMSFGSGSTKCPGETLARSGIKLLVVLMLTYLDLELCDPNANEVKNDLSRAGLGTMPPDGDVDIRVRVR